MIREMIWGPDGWPVVGEPLHRDALVPLDLPITASLWEHSVNFNEAPRTTLLQFRPDGGIWLDGEATDATWLIDGNVVTMTFPSVNAPGGAFVDTVTLSDDGRWYVGRNQNGTVIRGLRYAAVPEPSTLMLLGLGVLPFALVARRRAAR